MSQRLGKNQQKILLLLVGGLALGCSGSPKTYFYVLGEIGRIWKEINRQALERAIKSLYQSKLISEKQNPDGTVTMVLTDQGRKKALTYNLDKMEIKKSKWDKKWRVIIFDIPEKKRRVRDAVRDHLKRLGFYELQKSVFVHPHDCKNEINYIIEFYDIRKFVRFIMADFIDNELHLKKYFDLL